MTWLLLEQDRHLIHHLRPSAPRYRYRAVFRIVDGSPLGRQARSIGVMGPAEIRTVTDVERLTPDQRHQLVNERTSTDLSDVPDDFVERVRADGRRLLVERGVLDEG